VWASSGVALGGMTREEARAALLDSFRYDDQVIFTFRYGDQFWQYSAGDLGIGFDVEATLDQAFGAGRSESVVSNLAQQASIWLNGRGHRAGHPLRSEHDAGGGPGNGSRDQSPGGECYAPDRRHQRHHHTGAKWDGRWMCKRR
jgi:hypothetical protein